MEPECRVTLDNFAGPLDLLLHLIRKNKLDITDIPIALVTAQYLEYLEFMRSLDVVVAGEYLVMAATLLQIKSRMLLPSHDEEEEEDPRLEIARPLAELASIQEAAGRLLERPWLGKDVFVPPEPPFLQFKGEEGEAQDVRFDVSLHHLVTALKTALENQALPRKIEIERARVSVSDRMEEIRSLLDRRPRTTLFQLFAPGEGVSGDEARRAIIVTFLAVLELAKIGDVLLIQEAQGEDILIMRRT